MREQIRQRRSRQVFEDWGVLKLLSLDGRLIDQAPYFGAHSEITVGKDHVGWLVGQILLSTPYGIRPIHINHLVLEKLETRAFVYNDLGLAPQGHN
jgi:hypothetical protein